ncbi:MAG: prepilin-type N-terminal cleavage/methylation domain-containing protein [Planctomycetota bacterium]|nr:prepilin-type N-terminal cleavage/methylation domain-containing protein [Planctomycetota bacterium]
MRTLHPAPTARGGFTLLEILIVVAVMAMLAGAAIPVASKALSSAARKATREELVQLGTAAQEYFRDTGVAPAQILDLERKGDADGWAGPYLAGAMQDPLATSSGYTTDAWSRAYRAKTTGDVMTITSAGPDAALDTDDDVRIQVDFTPIRREETLADLKTINQAITLYNGLHGADQPLPGTWSKALGMLVTAGFLPEAESYTNDAWGNAYVGDPDGKSPLVRAASTSIANTSSQSGSSGSGSGPQDAKSGGSSKSGKGGTNPPPNAQGNSKKKG